MRRLTAANKDMYNKSERIASNWLDNELDVNVFIVDFYGRGLLIMFRRQDR